MGNRKGLWGERRVTGAFTRKRTKPLNDALRVTTKERALKIIKILLLLIVLMNNTHASGQPEEVASLENAFLSIPGISSASIGKHHYSKEEIAQLDGINFVGEYADLPIAMYKRSNGNLTNELLIYVEFTIERNEKGLKALEFISWWVRDLSRSGQNLQIRSIGLPPIADNNTQLGKTLRFWCEAYIVTNKEEMPLVLAKIGELANSLNNSRILYEGAFK
jgi:hypothetical protein